MNFTQEDIDFLTGLNSSERPESRIYLTAQHGYVRNLDHGVKQQLENIYKRVVDERFVLCFHCGSEVLKLVLNLYDAFEKWQVSQIAAPEAAPQDDHEPGPPAEVEPPKAPKSRSRAKAKPIEPEKIIGEGDE